MVEMINGADVILPIRAWAGHDAAKVYSGLDAVSGGG